MRNPIHLRRRADAFPTGALAPVVPCVVAVAVPFGPAAAAVSWIWMP